MNTKTDKNNPLTQLLQTAHLNDADSFMATMTPDLAFDPIRRRADAAHAAVARAGRFRHAHWGAFCLTLAIAVIGAAMLIPAASFPLASSGSIILALGLAMILRFDPKPGLQHVDAFDRFCQETQDNWAIATRDHVGATIQPIIEAVRQFPRDTIASGAGVNGVAAALRQAQARGREVEVEMQNLHMAACQATNRAEEDYTTSLSRLRASTRRWYSRLWAGSVQRLANHALDARESLLAEKRLAVILQLVREAGLTPMTQALREILQDLETNAADPLASILDASSQQINDYTKQGTRGPFGKIIPNPQEIVARSHEIVQARLPEIARSVATRPDAIPIAQAIEERVQTVLANNSATPQRLVDCLEQMQGGMENALGQMTDEAGPLAVANGILGRTPRHLRTLIVHGGSSSVMTKAIERRSEGCMVRGIEHDSEKEIIQINECRFEPGAELTELREASQSLSLLPDEMKAVMIVAVEDDAVVLEQCRPEQRSEPERGLKLLLRGLAFERLTRKGNTYQFNGVPRPDGISNGCLAQGFEAAVEALQTDAQQASRLQQAIDAETEARGLEGTCKAIQIALSLPNLVPADQTARARKILLDELQLVKRALARASLI